MVKDKDELMRILEAGLPDYWEGYIPELVQDFVLDYWGDLKKLLDND